MVGCWHILAGLYMTSIVLDNAVLMLSYLLRPCVRCNL